MKGLKCVISFALGTAVGGAVSWYITKKKVSEKDEKRRVADLASMKEYVDRLRAKDEAGELASTLDYISKDGEDVSVSESIRAVKEKDRKTEKNISKAGGTSFVDYTSYYKDVEAEMAGLEHPRDDSEEMTSERMKEIDMYVDGFNKSAAANSKSIKPKVISADEYDDPEYEHHDKVNLYYYVEDQIVTNETEDSEKSEELVPDPTALLGDTLTSSGFMDSDDVVLYVRNVSRGSDYEITKIFDSYENS